MKPLLRPSGYQLIALTKLLLNQTNALLIADGVGVGKTISAGYIVDYFSRQKRGPCLVVCPPTLVDKWRFELKLKFLLNPRTIRSHQEFETTRSELKTDAAGETYICSYSELEDVGRLPPFPVVIVDEIHNFRNSGAQRWEALLRVTTKASWRIGLSATPINNAESDLGNELSILLPQFSPSVISALIEDIWTDKQYQKLSPLITRFTKEQLGIHFAKRTIEDIGVAYPPSYGKRVRAILTQIRGEMPGTESYPLDSITYFREASSSPAAFEKSTGHEIGIEEDPKLRAFAELMGRQGSSMLVFCQFIETVEYLKRSIRHRETFVLTGDVPVSDREEVIQSFRDSDAGVLLLTSVGSEGLDLQFCHVVVNYDLHWNPMVLEQRIGRCDRIGQKKRFINVYNFHVANSIDERVLRTIGRKLRIISGSPFDSKAIVSSTEPLFDKESLKAETDHAASVLKALDYSAILRTEDLSVLRHVDKRFCRPGGTRGNGDTDWLTEGPETRQWLASIRTSSDAFIQDAWRLQSYVA